MRVASDRFMQCHRRRGEDILRFFFRLCDLYKSSKGLMGENWQENPTHVSHVFCKLYEGLYEEERVYIDRKLDKYLERGTLTVARLKKELIEINKMSSHKIRGEIPNPLSKAVMALETSPTNKSCDEEEQDDDSWNESDDIEEFYHED